LDEIQMQTLITLFKLNVIKLFFIAGGIKRLQITKYRSGQGKAFTAVSFAVCVDVSTG
jgi:hypothetical protein